MLLYKGGKLTKKVQYTCLLASILDRGGTGFFAQRIMHLYDDQNNFKIGHEIMVVCMLLDTRDTYPTV